MDTNHRIIILDGILIYKKEKKNTILHTTLLCFFFSSRFIESENWYSVLCYTFLFWKSGHYSVILYRLCELLNWYTPVFFMLTRRPAIIRITDLPSTIPLSKELEKLRMSVELKKLSKIIKQTLFYRFSEWSSMVS